MAVGAESYRRYDDIGIATAVAIRATQHLMKSFENRTKVIECEDFTKTDFKNKLSFAKYIFTGKFLSCYKLADKWAPEAVVVAIEGLELEGEETNYEMECHKICGKRFTTIDENTEFIKNGGCEKLIDVLAQN